MLQWGNHYKGRRTVTDKTKETLSALIDGEASEIEVHRLLRQLAVDDSLRPSWINYLQVRTVVRGEKVIDTERHLDLYRRISAAIVDEEDYALSPGGPSVPLRRLYKPAAALAVAASLVVAVFVGMNLTTAPGTGDEIAVSRPEATPIESQAAGLIEPESPQLELKELDEEKQRQLRAYLNLHDRMARMNPNARTVIYEESDNN